ncbi:MAG: hypothetical protein U0229_23905 [Anaeromyxobacter sp.]
MRATAFLRTLAALALALTAASCVLIHPRQPKPNPDQGDWAEARDAAMRGAQLYDGIDHRANAVAVHLTTRVREARAARLADWYAWSPAELDARLAQERAEAAAGEEFVVAFYTADLRANDLDAKESIWRVALVVEGINSLPTKIEGITVDWTVKQLYPVFGPFDLVYRVRFPKIEGGLDKRPYVLRLTSAMGGLDLDFAGPAKLPRGLDSVPPAAR